MDSWNKLRSLTIIRPMGRKILVTAFLLLCGSRPLLQAQEFQLFDRMVQVHGWLSQGFVYTNRNNWLTMNTSSGSGAMTDMGLNLSTRVTDRLRVGVQLYDRNLGQLGRWHPSLDWALADYRFRSWFGIRAGKVKTVLGLFNDTQDQDFLYTFALLPQGVYPTDLREATIAHLGGDIYGTIPLKRSASIAYTVFAGHRHDSVHSGYPYLLSQYGTVFKSLGGLQYGADLRLQTPAKGLLVGISRLNEDTSGKGTGTDQVNPGGATFPYSEYSRANWTNQFYAEYVIGRLHLDSEYRRYLRDQMIYSGTTENITDVRAWYVAGSYTLTERLRLGSYYSHYTLRNEVKGALAPYFPSKTDTSLPTSHIYDKDITLCFDLKKFWNIKLEAHFIDGYAFVSYPDGFYPQENPNGFKTSTNALVLRTAFYF